MRRLLITCSLAALSLTVIGEESAGSRTADGLHQFEPVCAEMSTFPRPSFDAPPIEDQALFSRLIRYARLARRHRLSGLASYYASFFDGRKTANGEIFRNRSYSAAHPTLPLGTWIEVRARATGKVLRMRVNDRGPFVKKFTVDLSRAAARTLGVDVTPDRHVEIRVIALPGETPLPEDVDRELIARAAGEALGDGEWEQPVESRGTTLNLE